jgi:hypothetical protein
MALIFATTVRQVRSRAQWVSRKAPLRWMPRPSLATIFAVVCVLLLLLVFEQDRVIASQRTLIRQLFHDSVELTATKAREARATRGQ